MGDEAQAFSPQGEVIKVKFVVKGKVFLCHCCTSNTEFSKWSETVNEFLLFFMLVISHDLNIQTLLVLGIGWEKQCFLAM